MIPHEQPHWEQLIGRPIKTARFGTVVFGRFGKLAYEQAGQQQVPWPVGLIVAGAGCEEQPRYGHPLTISLLQEAQEELIRRGGCRGVFVSNGFYRPPGLTWGIGRYADPHGVIDTADAWGHWRLAIDIGRTATAKRFGVTVETLLRVLTDVGFSRPFLGHGEGWHFRPNAQQRALYRGEL